MLTNNDAIHIYIHRKCLIHVYGRKGIGKVILNVSNLLLLNLAVLYLLDILSLVKTSNN